MCGNCNNELCVWASLECHVAVVVHALGALPKPKQQSKFPAAADFPAIVVVVTIASAAVCCPCCCRLVGPTTGCRGPCVHVRSDWRMLNKLTI